MMKQCLMTIAVFLFLMQLQGQSVSIHDKAFRKQLLENGFAVDTVTGKLGSNPRKLFNLTLQDSSIHNLQGLEIFENLKSLELKGLQITEVPDLKFAPSLKTLIIKDCPGLRALSLYENKMLKEVVLNGTALREVDLSFALELTRFEFNDNRSLLFVNIANGTGSFEKGMMQIEVQAHNNPALEVVLIDDSLNPNIGKIPYGYSAWQEDHLLLNQKRELAVNDKNIKGIKR